jgi:hypothetical protein
MKQGSVSATQRLSAHLNRVNLALLARPEPALANLGYFCPSRRDDWRYHRIDDLDLVAMYQAVHRSKSGDGCAERARVADENDEQFRVESKLSRKPSFNR